MGGGCTHSRFLTDAGRGAGKFQRALLHREPYPSAEADIVTAEKAPRAESLGGEAGAGRVCVCVCQ